MAIVRTGLPSRQAVLLRGAQEGVDFRPATVRGDAAVVSASRIRATRNVTNIFRDAPAATKQAGREWYPKAHDEAVAVGRTAGGSTRTGAGIIAAVSPSMSWENNIPAAHQLAGLPDHHIHAMGMANEAQKQASREIKAHEQVLGEGNAPAHLYQQHERARQAHMASRAILQGTPLNNQSTDNIIKGARIRAGETPESVLPQQKKTGNFYRNVADPSDPHPVTIDTHAHDAARMSKLPFKTNRGLSAIGRYDHFADAYRAATPRVGESHAHVVQATVWQHWKNSYGNDTGGARVSRAAPMDEELTGRDQAKQERAIAARSAATVKKRGLPPVDPAARAAGW